MKKKILIFYQNSSDSVFIKSIVLELFNRGYNVYFVTMAPKGHLNDFFSEKNIKNESLICENEKSISTRLLIKRLINYAKKNEIDIIFSHLQRANLLALISQYFIKAKVIPTRHHIDDVKISNIRNAIIEDKLVNFLSKKIIVLNQKGKEFLILNENVNENKIEIIPYGYFFNLYPIPEIPIPSNEKLILGIFGRINENKKVWQTLEILKALIQKNIPVFLYIVGDGPDRTKIENIIRNEGLQNYVELTGNLSNPLDYMAKCDVVLHPSISEASNQVVKEAGLLNKTIICVSDVGDFDEYIVNGENGIKLPKELFIEKTIEFLTIFVEKNKFDTMGKKLNHDVIQKFDIHQCVDKYEKLIERL